MNHLQIKYIECDCGHTDHVVRFCYFDDDRDVMYVHVQLPRERWYKRIWLGLRYIFGYQCRYGHWGETVLSPRELKELKALIKEFETPRLVSDK